MNEVTVRQLRNHGGEVLERVQRGETLVVSKDGAPVAELKPLPRSAPSGSELVARRRTLPPVDLAALRADLDEVLDPNLLLQYSPFRWGVKGWSGQECQKQPST